MCNSRQELSAKQYWEELLGLVTFWMVRERAATTGTVSVLRQASAAALCTSSGPCVTTCRHSCAAVGGPPRHARTALSLVPAAWQPWGDADTRCCPLMRQQVQRVCLEAAVPGLLNAIVENANHSEDSFLQDPDIMVVYLEQLVRCSQSITRLIVLW
jgi:hypothetical protein